MIHDKEMFLGFMAFKAEYEEKEVAAWEVENSNGDNGYIVQPWKVNTESKSYSDPSAVEKYGYKNRDIVSQYHTHPLSSNPIYFIKRGLSKDDMYQSKGWRGMPVHAEDLQH